MKLYLAVAGIVLSTMAGPLAAQPADAHAEKIAAIRKMIELTGGARIIDQMFNSMAASFKDPKQQEFLQQFRKELDVNQIYDIMIPAYDKNLSGEDIKGIVLFYQSPLGQKLLEAQPKIMADSMPKIMEWSQRVTQRLLEKMKEKGLQ
jgi:hypothetical protein